MNSQESESHMSVDASVASPMSICYSSQTSTVVPMSIPDSQSNSHDLDDGLDDEEKEWAVALNGTTLNNCKPANGKHGKWLIYKKKSEVQEVWERIKEATEDGDLGYRSSRSCKQSNAEYGKPDEFLICVFTYNVEDVLDLMRVRINLAMLCGIRDPIGYKTGAASAAGKYSHRGYENICDFRIAAADLENSFLKMARCKKGTVLKKRRVQE